MGRKYECMCYSVPYGTGCFYDIFLFIYLIFYPDLIPSGILANAISENLQRLDMILNNKARAVRHPIWLENMNVLFRPVWDGMFL